MTAKTYDDREALFIIDSHLRDTPTRERFRHARHEAGLQLLQDFATTVLKAGLDAKFVGPGTVVLADPEGNYESATVVVTTGGTILVNKLEVSGLRLSTLTGQLESDKAYSTPPGVPPWRAERRSALAMLTEVALSELRKTK